MTMIINSYAYASSASVYWDPAALGSGITLSNGNRDVTATGGSTWRSALGGTGKSAGKWQYECLVIASGGNQGVGLADRSNLATVLSTYLGSNIGGKETIGFLVNNLYWNLTGSVTSHSHGISYTAGDIITVTLDLTVTPPAAKWYKNGVLADSNTANMPSGKTWYPACSLQNTASIRLITGSLTHPQSGFTDWG